MLDSFVERSSRLLSFKRPSARDIRSLSNWLDGTASLAREETEYLSFCKDLVSLAAVDDTLLKGLEAWVEDRLIRSHQSFRKVCPFECSPLRNTPIPLWHFVISEI
jgi:hypothetical protein